jgi:hypothetical protein
LHTWTKRIIHKFVLDSISKGRFMLSVGPAIAEPDSQLDTRCIRPAAGGPLIQADRDALRQLEFYVRTGVNAIRGRGVEVGGLILGRPIDWNADELVITGFVPVEIEYRFGPTFRPSEADVKTFREAAAEEDGNVIGYFRSQLRGALALREEDRNLLTELFRTTDCCFAGAAADSQTPTTVGLHKVRAGAAPVLLERFPLLPEEKPEPPPVAEILVDPPPLAMVRETREIPDATLPYLPVVPIPSAEADTHPPDIVAARNSKWRRFAIASGLAGLFVTAVIGGVAYTSRAHSDARPNPLPVPVAKTLLARRIDSAVWTCPLS